MLDSDLLDFIADDGMDVEESRNVPPVTFYEDVCRCLCCTLSFVPSIRKYFINHWEILPKYPLRVLLGMTLCYLYTIFYAQPRLDNLPGFVFWFAYITSLIGNCAYVLTITSGPGYLPFYYPMEINQERDFLSGIAITPEQQMFAHRKKIPRAKFFRSARRIVICPDHFCTWAATFIGRKNHKQFFLFCFWTCVSGFALISIVVMVILKDFWEGRVLQLVLSCMFLVFVTSNVVFCLYQLIIKIINITHNQTRFEKLVKEIPVKRPVLMNWEAIFGPINQWYKWPFPFPAFPSKKDDDLLEGLRTERLL